LPANPSINWPQSNLPKSLYDFLIRSIGYRLILFLMLYLGLIFSIRQTVIEEREIKKEKRLKKKYPFSLDLDPAQMN